ncbi:hypothetical protein GBA65_14845 [Rubrobacter marinus]|uniref:Uncharacterized protein n=1 Tax=Rubrobacter marinus TaxID=2653852 RepID=A0A6G8PZC2_9ACTN|nr:hypothetical protein [Rubrobacter marinus]QIN79584.1 hypothetical protein GBA65_14845 [Rubrobacter marinus]
MSVRDWWRRITGRGREQEAPPRHDAGDLRRTRAERAARTGARLNAEAQAKESTAQDMREMGMEEAAESLEADVQDLKERVAKLERERATALVGDAAEAFEGRV